MVCGLFPFFSGESLATIKKKSDIGLNCSPMQVVLTVSDCHKSSGQLFQTWKHDELFVVLKDHKQNNCGEPLLLTAVQDPVGQTFRWMRFCCPLFYITSVTFSLQQAFNATAVVRHMRRLQLGTSHEGPNPTLPSPCRAHLLMPEDHPQHAGTSLVL